MTNFSTQCVLGPVISPLVSKDKGDVSNKLNCAGAQLANNAKIMLADTVVLGGTAIAAKQAYNGGKFANSLAKATDKLGSFLKKYAPKTIEKISKMPTKFKPLVPIVVLGSLAVGYITGKGIYKMGQIDQKYTDKAKIEAHQKQIV